MPVRPTVVSHRGLCAAGVREHTLAAYRRALENGADAVECDVRLTRDRVLVCVHGGWVPHRASRISMSSLAELRAAASRGDAGGVIEEGGDVLTFWRLLELVRDCGRRVQVHVETKHPTRHGGRVEEALVRALGRYGLLQPRSASPRIWVMSFSLFALRRLRCWAPTVPTVLLSDRPLHALRGRVLPSGVPAVGPSLDVLRADPAYVRWAQDQGRRVHAWTANSDADIAWLVDLGVDAIITDHPERVGAVLAGGAHRRGPVQGPVQDSVGGPVQGPVQDSVQDSVGGPVRGHVRG